MGGTKPLTKSPKILEQPAASQMKKSWRAGKKVISGHFDNEVAKALKILAAQKETTIQMLLALAINDFFEKNNLPRLADETPLPRGPSGRPK